MLAKSIREDIARLLLQWLTVRLERDQGLGIGGAGHPMWNQAARAPRAGNEVPLLQGDLEQTDKAMRALKEAAPYLYHLLLEARLDVEERAKAWPRCVHRTLEAKAAARNMGPVTYWRWVNKAEESFWRAYTGAKVPPLRYVVPRRERAAESVVELPKTGKTKRKSKNLSSPESRACASAPGR